MTALAEWRGGDVSHARESMAEFLEALEAEIERRIECRSGFEGAIREDERALSDALDQIASHRARVEEGDDDEG